MSDRDMALEFERRREAGRLLAVAEEDIRVARLCLASDDPASGAAAYHYQQAAEKLVKGMLVAAGIDFRERTIWTSLPISRRRHFRLAKSF